VKKCVLRLSTSRSGVVTGYTIYTQHKDTENTEEHRELPSQ
jgi:hypothetical protein